MILFERFLSFFSELQAHVHVHVQGPAMSRAQRATRGNVNFEPIEAQMAREMDEFDKTRKGAIQERDVADAQAAIRGGMPIKHVRAMYGEDVLERAQGSLQTAH